MTLLSFLLLYTRQILISFLVLNPALCSWTFTNFNIIWNLSVHFIMVIGNQSGHLTLKFVLKFFLKNVFYNGLDPFFILVSFFFFFFFEKKKLRDLYVTFHKVLFFLKWCSFNLRFFRSKSEVLFIFSRFKSGVLVPFAYNTMGCTSSEATGVKKKKSQTNSLYKN